MALCCTNVAGFRSPRWCPDLKSGLRIVPDFVHQVAMVCGQVVSLVQDTADMIDICKSGRVELKTVFCRLMS